MPVGFVVAQRPLICAKRPLPCRVLPPKTAELGVRPAESHSCGPLQSLQAHSRPRHQSLLVPKGSTQCNSIVSCDAMSTQ